MTNPGRTGEIPPEDHVHEADLRRSLRRGNINFEFLDHREADDELQRARRQERRRIERKDKRGLFNRGRRPRPVTRLSVALWSLLCLGAGAGLVAALLIADSLLWLLALLMVIL